MRATGILQPRFSEPTECTTSTPPCHDYNRFTTQRRKTRPERRNGQQGWGGRIHTESVFPLFRQGHTLSHPRKCDLMTTLLIPSCFWQQADEVASNPALNTLIGEPGTCRAPVSVAHALLHLPPPACHRLLYGGLPRLVGRSSLLSGFILSVD